MEYLVTMTTHVPDGTPEGDVEQIRAAEAARSRELAAQRHLLRLWRPPLRPGEWRTLGLFAAADDDQLEQVLATMPLRVWRHDQVEALTPHPDDPGRAATAGTSEFLTTLTSATPAGEAARAGKLAGELAGTGQLLRLWRLPGTGRSLGLWQARDLAEMQATIASQPLGPGLTVEITPLTAHPSDPVNAGG